MSNSALDSVMDNAEGAAAAMEGAGTSLANQQQGGAVAQQGGGAPARPSLDAMADSAGINVDQYLTIKDTGFRFDKGSVFEEFEGTLDVTEVAPIFSVRATRGGATTFEKSYDGVMSSKGQNWQQTVSHLQATHEKVDGPYQTAEIPLTLLAAVGGEKKGTRIGITPSITGVKFWNALYQELREQGLTSATVKVKVKHKFMTNKNGNEWGCAEFELLGEA